MASLGIISYQVTIHGKLLAVFNVTILHYDTLGSDDFVMAGKVFPELLVLGLCMIRFFCIKKKTKDTLYLCDKSVG